MTEKVNLLIWSKNRAAQLDLLLRSIEKFVPNSFVTTVLYKADEEFKDTYEIAKAYHEDVWFLEEQNFWQDTQTIIYDKGFDWVALSTDDTAIFQSPPFPISEALAHTPDIFSLRYGLNTVVQDPHSKACQPILRDYDEPVPGMIQWPFSIYRPNHNYGYPFGLDMHIYRREMLFNITRFYDNIVNTNTLESRLYHEKHKISPYLCAYKHSIAVNIPDNNMSNVTQASHDGNHIQELNNKFKHTILSLDTLNVEVVGSHQEIPLIWENDV